MLLPPPAGGAQPLCLRLWIDAPTPAATCCLYTRDSIRSHQENPDQENPEDLLEPWEYNSKDFSQLIQMVKP